MLLIYIRCQRHTHACCHATPRPFGYIYRDSSGSLDLEQLLGLIPGAHLVSCAARILLQESALQGLVEEADDPRAAALTQQASAVLREVLTRAFLEADPHGTGLIQPGEQLMQLLFAAAAQLTSILVGAAPSLQEGVPGAWCGCGGAYGRSRHGCSRGLRARLLAANNLQGFILQPMCSAHASGWSPDIRCCAVAL